VPQAAGWASDRNALLSQQEVEIQGLLGEKEEMGRLQLTERSKLLREIESLTGSRMELEEERERWQGEMKMLKKAPNPDQTIEFREKVARALGPRMSLPESIVCLAASDA